MTLKSKTRSGSQNDSLHLWFTQVAEDLNDKGIYQRAVLEQLEHTDVPNSKESIKAIWTVIQKTYIKKDSTTKLNNSDINIIYDALNLALGTKFGVHIPFPCEEELKKKGNNYD